MNNTRSAKPLCRILRFILPLSLVSLALPAHAIVFNSGDFKVTFDTTLSVGGIYRLDNPSPEFYGTSNGGFQNSVNSDDGNLNYRRGWASELVKGTHTLELKWHDFGALASGYYFYDVENKKHDRARTPLSDAALDRVGSGGDFLDLYVRGKFEIANHALDLRFGRQVLNLGESTFIPNGINVVNSVDAAKLRVPGAELREVLLPVNMLKASLGVTDNVTLEAFWLLEFRRTEIDPAGSYFSTNDFATRGGNNVYLGFGSLSDQTPLGAVPRGGDREGGNYNQFGADVHISVPALNNTDFGFYFANYHSRLPVISARTPTGPVTSAAVAGALTGLLIQNGVPAASAPAAATGILTLAATNPAALTASQLALYTGARTVALLNTAATARYFIEYPENIHMFGVSFNTSLGNTGVACQGEVSYKHGVPLQIDDVELLFATLSTLSPTYGTPVNQIGSFLGQYETEIPGYRRKDVWTAQTTLTKTFGPTLGASQFTLIGEIGGVYVPNLPAKDVLRFDGTGTFTSGSQYAMNAAASPGSAPLQATPLSAFPDALSWGYQVVGRLEYNNVFLGINVTPSIAYVQDVQGNTPLPLGNFEAGRRSINLVTEFSWQNSWSLEVRYVNYFGAGHYNLLADRDYVATTLKFSF